MKFDPSKVILNLEKNESRRKKRDAFRNRFPMSQTFFLPAKLVSEFIREHAIADGKSYGLIAAGEVVEDDNHLLELLGDQDRVGIEFRHTDWESHGRADDAHQWLLQFGERE